MDATCSLRPCRNHKCHKKKFFTRQETYGTPVVAAEAASINFTKNSFPRWVRRAGSFSRGKPVLASAPLPLRHRCVRQHKLHGGSFHVGRNICDTLGGDRKSRNLYTTLVFNPHPPPIGFRKYVW